MDSLGFAYPAKLFAGKPSHHKAYDEGYLVTDARNCVFQLKQVNGILEVRAFPQADNLGVKYLNITEFENHATLGILVDAENKLHMLTPDGRVLPTGVTYIPEKEDFLVVTQNQITLEPSVSNPELSEVKLTFATVLKLVPEERIFLTGFHNEGY